MHADRIRKGETPMKKKESVSKVYRKIPQHSECYFCNGSHSGSECSCDRDRCIDAFYKYFYF